MEMETQIKTHDNEHYDDDDDDDSIISHPITTIAQNFFSSYIIENSHFYYTYFPSKVHYCILIFPTIPHVSIECGN
jgi:hypothetical protein